MFTYDESRVLFWSRDAQFKLWDSALHDAELTPAERILELEVRSATRLYSAGQVVPLIVPLKSAEWLDKVRAWDRVKPKTKTPKRPAK